MGEKKLWTQFQDNCLKYLKQQCRIEKWSQIAMKLISIFDINGRNQKQCRDRYLNNLNPNINFERWSEEDQHKLIDFHRKFGNRWTLIAQNFKGRTDSFVKNHFYSRLRKCIRKLNNQLQSYFKKHNKNYKKFNLNIIFKLTNLVQGNFSKISNDVKLHYQELLYKMIRDSIQIQTDVQLHCDDLQQIQSRILSLNSLENLSGLIEGNGRPKRGRGAKKLEKYQITHSGKYLTFSSNGVLQIESEGQIAINYQDNINGEGRYNENYDFGLEQDLTVEKPFCLQNQGTKTAQNQKKQMEFRSNSDKSQNNLEWSQRQIQAQTFISETTFQSGQITYTNNPLKLMALQLDIQFQQYRKSQSNCSDLMQQLLQQDNFQARRDLMPIFQIEL